MKDVKIGNELFEVIKPRKHKPDYAVPSPWDYMDIYEAYKRPSIYKV